MLERYELANGLRIIVMEDHSAPVVAYHTWFRVGSRHEVEGKTGLAHLFEHLMFNETVNLKSGEFDRKLELAGAHANAATWNDWTYYHEDLPASQLGLVVALESERMHNLVLRAPQLRSEKEVVANERRFRVDDDVDGTINELLYRHAFDVHPYHHPTIGWMDDILGFTLEDCRLFYRTYYSPNNATIIIVGDIDTKRVLRQIDRAYGALRPAQIPAERAVAEPTMTTERRVRLSRATPTARLTIGYRAPALADPDHAALSILADALFGGRSARFYRRLVNDRELATDLSASPAMFRDPGLFELDATAREGVTGDALLEAIDGCLSELARVPITDEERTRALARVELGFLQGMETVGGRAEQIGFYDTVMGDPAGSLARLDALRAVTVERLNVAAARWVDPRQRTVVIVDPAAER